MDKSKLLIIVLMVLVVLSIGVSAFTMVQVMSISKTVNSEEKETTAIDPSFVPVAERAKLKLTDSIIAQYKKTDSDGNKRLLNISMDITIHLNANEKSHEDVLALMTNNEEIIRDRIGTLLKEKKYDFMASDEAQPVLKQEIREILNTSFQTDTVVEVVFGNFLTSEK